MSIPSIGDNSNFNDKKDNVNRNAQSQIEARELPIVKFAREYELILVNEVIPSLVPYDKQRRHKYFVAIIASFFFVVAGFLSMLFTHFHEGAVKLSCASFAFSYMIWQAIKKNFERRLKVQVMPKLMKAFPDFYWYETSTIPIYEINSVRIFPKSIQADKSFDDAFSGRYLGVKIDIAECKYQIKEGK